MANTVQEEVDRAAQYVETKLDELGAKIAEILAEGLAYDLEIRKNGEKVHQMPSAIAGILVGLSFLPPAQLASMIALLGANFAGYTFHLRKVEPTAKK